MDHHYKRSSLFCVNVRFLSLLRDFLRVSLYHKIFENACKIWLAFFQEKKVNVKYYCLLKTEISVELEAYSCIILYRRKCEEQHLFVFLVINNFCVSLCPVFERNIQ
jgi:hypothetical protein